MWELETAKASLNPSCMLCTKDVCKRSLSFKHPTKEQACWLSGGPQTWGACCRSMSHLLGSKAVRGLLIYEAYGDDSPQHILKSRNGCHRVFSEPSSWRLLPSCNQNSMKKKKPEVRTSKPQIPQRNPVPSKHPMMSTHVKNFLWWGLLHSFEKWCWQVCNSIEKNMHIHTHKKKHTSVCGGGGY